MDPGRGEWFFSNWSLVLLRGVQVWTQGAAGNESELRFILGNPIIEILCTTFDLQVIYSLSFPGYQ